MIDLTKRDDVYVLHLGSDENRFSLDWITSVNAALDDVVQAPAPLVSVAEGKFYSNGLVSRAGNSSHNSTAQLPAGGVAKRREYGPVRAAFPRLASGNLDPPTYATNFQRGTLDLEWLMANGDQLEKYVGDVQDLLARVLTLPVPTVAAVSGHAFGAGATLAMAHDWRIMRADRGYFCFPEVDIRIPFSPGMAALVQAKLTPQTAIVAMSTGRRYTAPDALAAALVDATAGEADLLTLAVAKVAALAGKDSGTLGAIKATMFAAASEKLRDREPATASH